ncbi:LOW QUALITY PROTEIN: hypothetical protein KUTeg_015195 [Tegillarca granosa]|uniref:Methyltransferase FkbM domain-containing protein n=1 Tax=Tegillarca granosa TaxID=220873 RepID=A0ABQ9ERW4_TEGGR|nr:LOW QUALITY PROTEIN: hypothetical protein KUTeg_015195 [Tegillarca granosa]
MGGKYQNMEKLFQIFKNETRFGNTPIYVHDPKNDVFVSKSYLTSDSNLNFIDIGANLGVFSLTVAKSGRKVLVFEALYKNLRCLCMSIRDGGLKNEKGLHVEVLLQKSEFKGEEIGQLSDYLKSDLNLNFIDIGANLDAKSGQKVLAIEELYKNVQRLNLKQPLHSSRFSTHLL